MRERWGTLTAARWLGPRVAVVTGGGVRPAGLPTVEPGRGRARAVGAFAVLGVRLAPVRPPAVLAAVHPRVRDPYEGVVGLVIVE